MGLLGAGMAANVAERFLNYAKEGELNGLGQTADFSGNLKVYFYLGAGRKTFHHPACCGNQAGFVEQRGMQKLRERANFLEALVNPLRSFHYGFFMGLEVSRLDPGIELQ